MIELYKLLKYVQRTNTTMKMEKLIDEFGKTRYSSISLVMVSQNIRQEK